MLRSLKYIIVAANRNYGVFDTREDAYEYAKAELNLKEDDFMVEELVFI